MTIERYCSAPECTKPGKCYMGDDEECHYLYRAETYAPAHRWSGEGNPPARWWGSDGTLVYRSFADYCDD